MCLQGFPSMTQSASQVPARLSALAQPSALGSAALLPWSPPGSPLLSSGLCTSLHLPPPRTLGRLLFHQRLLPPTLTKQQLSCFSLCSFFFFFPLTSASRPYATALICFDVPSHQNVSPSETGGCVKSLSHCCAWLFRMWKHVPQ